LLFFFIFISSVSDTGASPSFFVNHHRTWSTCGGRRKRKKINSKTGERSLEDLCCGCFWGGGGARVYTVVVIVRPVLLRNCCFCSEILLYHGWFAVLFLLYILFGFFFFLLFLLTTDGAESIFLFFSYCILEAFSFGSFFCVGISWAGGAGAFLGWVAVCGGRGCCTVHTNTPVNTLPLLSPRYVFLPSFLPPGTYGCPGPGQTGRDIGIGIGSEIVLPSGRTDDRDFRRPEASLGARSEHRKFEGLMT
jgi:hypothetical protein